MCGIAGIIYVDKCGALEAATCSAAFKSMQHRGPDDYGLFVYGNDQIYLGKNIKDFVDVKVAFFHVRLSILDLSDKGCQPMMSSDGRYSLVFNGEIYNYIELRSELRTLGYNFVTETDVEVLLYAYIAWGEKALLRFEGMFAFVIFDTIEQTIFMARDFFGIKPLYFAYFDGRIFFASELKTILAISGISRIANPQKINDYLRFGVTDHGIETIIDGINQIPAAHYIKLSLLDKKQCELEPVRYWKTQNSGELNISFNEAAEQLKSLFLRNIKLHMRSDVSVGAALSGGVDSSAIVSAMRYLEPDIDIHTFSYISSLDKLSEEKWVDIVTKEKRTLSHKVSITSSDLVTDLDELVYTQDVPFGSTGIYAQYRVFKMAKECGIKVMLDGQGADEMLGGYQSYLGSYFASLCKKLDLVAACKLMFSIKSKPDMSVLDLLVMSGAHFLDPRIEKVMRYFTKKSFEADWINSEWLRGNNIKPLILSRINDKNVLRGHLRQSIEQYGLVQLLRYEDRNSMHFSIESRVPFLTPNLVDFVLSLPESFIINNRANTKAIFKEAMSSIMPKEILDRKDKIGFATPEYMWLKEMDDWVQKVLYEAEKIKIINLPILKTSWERMVSGELRFDSRIWRAINFIRWACINNIIV